MSGQQTAPADPNSITVPTGEPQPGQTATAGNVGDGFIVGTEPAKTPDELRAEAAASQQQPSEQAPGRGAQTNGERLFTADEVEGFRQQEKEKVYGRVESLEAQLAEINAEREQERAAAETARREAEEAARRETEENMDAKELVQQVREELRGEIQESRQEAEMAKAMLEQEQKLSALNDYRRQALAAVEDRLVPDIADYIGGESPEEIDQSIATALEKSERIAQGFMSAQQQQMQGMRGTRPTVPAGNGPLEEQQEQRQMTPEDIKNMSPSEYQAMRGTLHQAGRAQFYGQR